MSHIKEGDRVFVEKTKKFGDVKRTRFLGKTGAVLAKDDGTLEAFGTNSTKSDIYNKDTMSNDEGVTIESQMDVKYEGISILTSLNISPEDQKLFFLKFIIGLTQEEQENYITEFNSVKDNVTDKEEFLSTLLTTLENDEEFIQKEGLSALFYIDTDIRGNMFQKLLTQFNKEQREDLILEWTSVKNDVGGKEEFLHNMYSLLMDDDEYIKTEGVKALSEMGLSSSKQSDLFSKFLMESTDETKAGFISEWKKVRSSKSRRHFFLKKVIMSLE